MADTNEKALAELDFDNLEDKLAELDASAFMKAERECRMAADPAPDIMYSSLFRAKLAAAAMNVPAAKITALPVPEFASVTSRVLNFLLQPLAKTVIRRNS